MMVKDALKGLPHSYPFRFLDRVVDLSRERGTAIKNVTVNEAFFEGHFKHDPVMPGVLIIESLAQLAGLVLNSGLDNARGAYVAQVRDMRFRRPVIPGDRLILTAELKNGFDALANFSVRAEVDGKAIADGEIVMARTP